MLPREWSTRRSLKTSRGWFSRPILRHLLLGSMGLGMCWPLWAEESVPSSECRSRPLAIGCGFHIDSLEDLQNEESRKEELEAARHEGGLKDEEWKELYFLHNGTEHRERALQDRRHRYLWEASDATETTRGSYDPLEYLLAWQRHSPENPDPWMHMAELHGDPETAVEVLQRGLEVLPGHSRLVDFLAIKLHEAGRTREGLGLLREHVAAFEDDQEAWLMLHNFSHYLDGEEIEGLPSGTDLRLEVARETVDRWPENPSTVAEAFLYEDQDPSQMDAYLDRLLAETWEPKPLAALCGRLFWGPGDDSKDPRTETCFRRLVSLLEPVASTEEERSMLWNAHQQLLRWGLQHEEPELPKEILLTSPDYGWVDLWQSYVYERPAEGCGLLAEQLESGALDERVFSKIQECPRRTEILLPLLRECGLAIEMGGLEESLRGQFEGMSLEELGNWREIVGPWVRAELERRVGLEPGNADLYQALAEQFSEGSPGWIEVHQRWAKADSQTLEPLFRLATRFLNAEDFASLGEVLGQGIERRPEEAELQLAAAVTAFLGGDLVAAEKQAKAISEAVDTSHRERVEAGYLLGRIQRERGDLEGATGPLQVYFETLLRFEPCASEQFFCDMPYLDHLAEMGDRPRLEKYFDLRKQAIQDLDRNQWHGTQVQTLLQWSQTLRERYLGEAEKGVGSRASFDDEDFLDHLITRLSNPTSLGY